MKNTILALVATLSFSAFASDHWDNCSNAEGNVKLENGILTIDGVGEIAEQSVKIKELQVIKKETEKCVLQKSGRQVISFDNTISIDEVTYTIEENDKPMTSVVICERGGSGIPANDNCRE